MNDDNIKKYAKDNHVPIMLDGGISFLVEYVKEHNIKRVLEIGTAIGYSAIKMAEVADDVYIDTVEINHEMVVKANENIQTNHLESRIHVYESDALTFTIEGLYDLIFIDAAKAQYKRYLEHYLMNSDEHTVFVFDNLNFHGMVDDPSLTNNRNTKALVKKIKAFRDWLNETQEYEVKWHLDIGDGLAIIKRKI